MKRYFPVFDFQLFHEQLLRHAQRLQRAVAGSRVLRDGSVGGTACGAGITVAGIIGLAVSLLAPIASVRAEDAEGGLVPGRRPGTVTTATEGPKLRLSIDSPEPGAVIGDPGGMAFIAGRALAHYGEFQTFDIVFVIDQSDSTSAPTGADIDGDGKVGQRTGESWLWLFSSFLPLPNTDPGDSVLAAEIAAVRTMLDQLDPRTTRVGIVAFSGDSDPMTPDAQVFVPLTARYERVIDALDEIEDIGPQGLTNMSAAVNAATIELIGSQSALSQKREGARRVMMFLTDGRPTLPFDQSTHENRRLTIAAAAKAARASIRIDTFAIGEDALSDATVTQEMAKVTNGIFTPVMQPQDLQSLFEQASFSEIEQLTVRNVTNDQISEYVQQSADGSFSALLPMEEGDNDVEIYARSSDGTERKQRQKVRFLANAGVQPLSPALLAMRSRLMAARLEDLKRRAVELQAVVDEEARDKLVDEMEKVRKEMERSVEIQATPAPGSEQPDSE
jgi:hypothetical protein